MVDQRRSSYKLDNMQNVKKFKKKSITSYQQEDNLLIKKGK